MKYDVEMDPGAKKYIPSFVKICSGIQKLIEWGFSDTQAGLRLHKPTFIFSG
jgi:hypothetical protein